MIAHLTQVTLILAAIGLLGTICVLLVREQLAIWQAYQLKRRIDELRRRIDEEVRKLSALGEDWTQNKDNWTPEAYDRLMKDIREV